LGDAQLVGISSGISFVDPVGEGASYYYWARHVSLYDIQGPFNSANGTLAETALDVEELLAVLTGAITESQLYQALAARINLIDGASSLAGSVNARILAETNARNAAIQAEAAARSAAILAEANARGTAITNEATIRSDADTALASSISTVSAVVNTKNRVYRQTAAPTVNLVVGDVWYDSDDSNKVYRWDGSSWVPTDDSRIAANTAAIQTEVTARADADSAQVLARETLAAQIRGSYTGTDVTQLSSGLVYSERQARVTADSALASRSDALEATVNNPTTGLVATRATLINDYYTKTATDSAIASASSTLTSNFNNTLAGYVTNATLTNNYYTASQTNSAISAATTNLVSTTTLNSTLGNYVTNATLTNGYYTKTQTDSAISASVQNLVSTTTLNNTLSSYVTTATLTNSYYTKTQTDSAISSASNTLTATFNNTLTNYATTAAVQQNYYAKASGEGLEAQYTVKIDLNGFVSGFGLASTAPVNGTPSSEFIVRADRFSIASPGQTTIIPFIVQATPTTINGVSVPAGVYMNDAYIRNGTITNAKIGNAAIDDAKIASLSADKITAGFINTARLSIDGITLDSVWRPDLGRNVLKIKDLAIDDTLIANNANISGAKIGSLNVEKLTGDVTKYVTATAYPSGAIPTSPQTYLTMTLPKSTHSLGHKPYVQALVQNTSNYVTFGFIQIFAAPIGDGTATPDLGPLYPSSQAYIYETVPEFPGFQYQVGWSITFLGDLDISVGDTITADTGASGIVFFVSSTGTSTTVSVENYTDSLGSNYTRSRPTLANGQVGTYVETGSTYWDANDMFSVTLFCGMPTTKRELSVQIRLSAQYPNTLYIKQIDALLMGIR
jgi:hypothetical protein